MTKPEARSFVSWQRPDSRLIFKLACWLGLVYAPLVLLHLFWTVAVHVAAELGGSIEASVLLRSFWNALLPWGDRPSLAACFCGPVITLASAFAVFIIAAGLRVNFASGK